MKLSKMILAALAAACLLLGGCGDEKVPTPSADLTDVAWHAAFGEMAYGDKVYVGTPLREYNFVTGDKAAALCMDPLCKHGEECTSFMANVNIFTLDVTESREGEIFYIIGAKDDPETGELAENAYFINRVDVANHAKSAVVSGLATQPFALISCRDTLFYNSVDGDGVCNLHAVKKDGSDPRVLANDDRYLRLVDVTPDAVYYYDATGQFYTADWALSNEQPLVKTAVVPSPGEYTAFVDAGALYYIDDTQSHTLSADITATEGTLYRVTREDPTPKKVVEHISPWGIAHQNGTVYYQPYAAIYRGEVKLKDKSGTKYQKSVISISDGTLMSLDLKAGQTATVVEKAGYNFVRVLTCTDDHVVFEGDRIDYEDMDAEYAERNAVTIYCLNRADGSVRDMDVYNFDLREFYKW